ncbi:SPFH domain-containing protein [Streptomyces sp. NPDC059708]|uniref:SPFH domain-containing protein n=1 Tax=Streptomyces sp. NPDC059708 TaxID=3346916 RepID=UPI0036C16273
MPEPEVAPGGVLRDAGEPEQPTAPAPRAEPHPLAARTGPQHHAEPPHPAPHTDRRTHAVGATPQRHAEPPHPAPHTGWRTHAVGGTPQRHAEPPHPAPHTGWRTHAVGGTPEHRAEPRPATARPAAPHVEPQAPERRPPTSPASHAAPQPPTAPADPHPPAPPAPRADPARGDVPAARGGAGVPGPGVAEIVAQAVARGIEGRDGTRGGRGRGAGGGAAAGAGGGGARFGPRPEAPAAAPPRRPAERTAPAARRVPRGDERLREHRGPVLPGWIAVVVGFLALTGCAAVLWRAGVVPATLVAAFGMPARPYQGLRVTHWPPLAFLGIVTLLSLGGLGRAKAGHAWVLTLFGRYRGTVRRTGLTWISPLLLRRRVDVRLRHWRSEPMPAVDSGGLALQVVVQVVWQVRDTARATLAVEDHIDYLAEQVESATARVLSRLPADAFHDDAPTLRDAEAVGEALTRTLAAETEAVGIEVFSAQPTRIEYAPEVAEAMRRRRIAVIDAKHRDTVLTAVVDAVDDTVHRLTSRGIVDLDDYERKALVKDLTVAFYTGRSDQ